MTRQEQLDKLKGFPISQRQKENIIEAINEGSNKPSISTNKIKLLIEHQGEAIYVDKDNKFPNTRVYELPYSIPKYSEDNTKGFIFTKSDNSAPSTKLWNFTIKIPYKEYPDIFGFYIDENIEIDSYTEEYRIIRYIQNINLELYTYKRVTSDAVERLYSIDIPKNIRCDITFNYGKLQSYNIAAIDDCGISIIGFNEDYFVINYHNMPTSDDIIIVE